MNSLGEPRCHFQKSVNVHRAILKSKIGSENLVLAQFTLIFSQFHVQLDMTVFATPKTTFENKSDVIRLRRKQKYSLKRSFVRKIESKR